VASLIFVFTTFSSFSLIRFVRDLCHGSSGEKLLAERILILTLVTLLNIPNHYVDKKFEVSIRKELFQLDKAVPKRLESLIHVAKKGKRYPDVASCLAKYFSLKQHNELVYCTWHNNSNNPLGLRQLD
ncbi:unnamed protein product, partial [Lymnaea stagnalis]